MLCLNGNRAANLEEERQTTPKEISEGVVEVSLLYAMAGSSGLEPPTSAMICKWFSDNYAVVRRSIIRYRYKQILKFILSHHPSPPLANQILSIQSKYPIYLSLLSSCSTSSILSSSSPDISVNSSCSVSTSSLACS